MAAPRHLSVTACTAQGHRKSQKDRYFAHVFKDEHGHAFGAFVAVMDGHGGPQTAQLILEILPHFMPTALAALRDARSPRVPFLKDICGAIHAQTSHHTTGSTFCAALVDLERGEYDVVQLGGSTALLVHDEAIALFTRPHTHALSPEDAAQATENDESKLLNTRAFGDRDVPGILRNPDFISGHVEPGDALLIATDGIISSVRAIDFSADLHEVAREIHRRAADASRIVEQATLRTGGDDNATAILIRFD